MSVTPIRRGVHQCDLPFPENHPKWEHRDIVRCDTCGRYWELWMPGWRWDGVWQPITRLTGWLLRRRQKPGHTPA